MIAGCNRRNPLARRRVGDDGERGFAQRHLGVLLMLGVLLAPAAPAQDAARVGYRTDAESIGCEALGAHDPRGCAVRVLRQLRARAQQRLIDTEGLHATAEDVAAVRAYEAAFARHDREQRARKLEELETRLVHMAPEIPAAERSRLLEFHAVLERLAAYEAGLPSGARVQPEVPDATLVQWIEQAKLDARLYRRYGGTVGIDPAGAYPHAARAALIAEYMLREGVEIPDREVARHFFAALWAPPAIAYEGAAAPDFTAYWERPLVPSYMGRADRPR